MLAELSIVGPEPELPNRRGRPPLRGKQAADGVEPCALVGSLADWEIVMVEKCANPSCPALFHSLRDGRLFVNYVDDFRSTTGRPRQLLYLWLCHSCSRKFTVVFENGESRVVPLADSSGSTRAAS